MYIKTTITMKPHSGEQSSHSLIELNVSMFKYLKIN